MLSCSNTFAYRNHCSDDDIKLKTIPVHENYCELISYPPRYFMNSVVNGIFIKLKSSNSEMTRNMNSVKSLLFLTVRQRKVCKRLQSDRGRLYRMAFAWTHNEDVADEVVQETMIKAIQKVNQLKNMEALDGWLFRVMANCFIDICRRHREHVDIDDVVLFEEATPESVHSQNEMLASVRSAIARLPLKHRQVLTLIDIENFTYAEVSDILRVPIGTIMSRLNRARQALKQILDEANSANNINATLRLVR